MGATKTDHFSKNENELATLTKALGHPARIAILNHLTKVGTCICADIVNELPLAQPTVSQHLKELKNAGIIKGNIEGNAICYCIDENTLQKLTTYINNISKNISTRTTCC
ncbi:ArsR/SmtB family transcription factor [Flavobacterium sp.]